MTATGLNNNNMVQRATEETSMFITDNCRITVITVVTVIQHCTIYNPDNISLSSYCRNCFAYFSNGTHTEYI